MKNLKATNIVTIGASAGGLSAVSKLLSLIPADVDAALFIVIHLSKNTVPENVLQILNRKSHIKVEIPENGASIEKGKAYLAPSNKHMMLQAGKILIAMGPMENHWRPSIDVLFRTAAAEYDSCVTGIILTGLLDDGSSGMSSIKAAGGTCIVQEPDEAEFPDMPNNVLKNIDVDYRVPIIDMGYILTDLYSRGECKPSKVPEQLRIESEITLKMGSSYEVTKVLGVPTALTCPDCGGILTKINENGNNRYRCFTGHAFTENILGDEYADKIEETLWVAIRMMEERKNFISSLENHAVADLIEERKRRTDELKVHIERLKEVLREADKAKHKNP